MNVLYFYRFSYIKISPIQVNGFLFFKFTNKLHLLKVTIFFFTHFLHGLLLRNQAVTKTPLFTLSR